MTQSMWNSLSALTTSQNWLNATANNLANTNTPGFAADTTSFADTLTQALSGRATAANNASRYTPPGWWGGTGVTTLKTEKNFSQMPLNQTGNPTDLAIQGNAFFVVQGPNNQALLTKAGNFIWSKQQNGLFVLATPQGQPVLDVSGQPIQMPNSGATSPSAKSAQTFSVGPDGQVSWGGKPAQKIALADVFLPGQTLTSVGNNEFALSGTAGAGGAGGTVGALFAGGLGTTPGTAGTGSLVQVINRTGTPPTSTVVQGSLAGSNVNMTSAMADVLQAEQMYNLNTEALQLTNKMMNDAVTITP